ncbi:hypothetical protein, partial [Parabacteroides sp. ZJ-118]|uniref:hypothetical protein n=1 Tax=Parabacteroides sp. ZJ-118 TaxID=2709398 RepID=UPI0013EB91BF
MNKKFSTLLVGLMLASAMSVGAQNENPKVPEDPKVQEDQKEDQKEDPKPQAVQKYESNKTYLLGDGKDFISVVSTPGEDYGKLVLLGAEDVNKTIQSTSNSLWSVAVTQGANGNAPKFTYVNKATGLTLAVDASKLDDKTPSVPAVIGGATSEWLNTVLTDAGSGKTLTAEVLRSYLDANTVAYLEIDSKDSNVKDGKDLLVKKALANASDLADKAVKVAPYEAALVENIDAYALNTQLGTAPEGWFNLSFDKDVTSEGSNLFANTALKAVQVTEGTGDSKKNTDYVMLMAKDKKAYDKEAFIVVDTVYHSGTESVGQLVKFTYANADEQGEGKSASKIARLKDAYQFDFDYSPSDERLIIKVKNYKIKGDKTDVSTGVAGAYTEWNEEAGEKDNYYLRLATLTTARELTIASKDVTAATDGVDDKANGMLTKVTIGVSTNTFVPTTLAEGIYMIKLRTSGYGKSGSKRSYEADGDYYIANLAGACGYMPQQKNQNFDHMPAAQWVVKKASSSDTAPVKVYNREFGGEEFSGQLFKAGDNVFFAGNDTLEFVKVSKESAENDKLGYKYVTELDTDVERYLFNYLHGLADDKFLSVPSDKDSIVRVDENGAKSNFRLEIVVKDDKYGYDDKLVRNVYRVVDNWGRRLGYDSKTKKYVLSKSAYGVYFLKENNDVEGKEYYTLVEANFRYVKVTQTQAEAWYPKWCEGMKVGDAPTIAEYYGGKNPEYKAEEGEDAPKYLVDPNGDFVDVPIYDKDGKPLVVDGSKVDFYTYQNVDGKIALKEAGEDQRYSWQYASVKVSVDDNTLDLVNGNIDDKFITSSHEARNSAFAVEIDDAPLYRRFNIKALGESETDSAQCLAFVENVRNEYL